MAMKELFYSEVHIGDKVSLVIGPKEVTGTVVELDADFVRIRRENGRPAVYSPDSISGYEIIEEAERPSTENVQSKETPTITENVQLKESATITDNINKFIVQITDDHHEEQATPQAAASSTPKATQQAVAAVTELEIKDLTEKANQLVREGKYDQAYKLVEKQFKSHPEDKALSELLQYVSRVKGNANKYKSLPKDNSFYARALREWHLYENYELAMKYYMRSINAKESRFFSAIMDYVDLAAQTKGDDEAIRRLMSFKSTIDQAKIKYEYKTKYYEKLASLYLKKKDYENLMKTLDTLYSLYKNQVEWANSKASREKWKGKVATTLFRKSTNTYVQGKYKDARMWAEKALNEGHSVYTCAHQMVKCCIALHEYDLAREIVHTYADRDYNLTALMDVIDTNEEAARLANNEGSNVRQYEVLEQDSRFVDHYEAVCSYEGVSEEKRVSREFTDEDLRNVDQQIKYLAKIKLKDRADYYLTAACIERRLNDKSERYYYYLANSMLYRAQQLLTNHEYDCAKSYYLTAIKMSQRTSQSATRIEQDAVCGYLCGMLKRTDQENEGVKFESRLMILMPEISGQLAQGTAPLFDVIRLLNTSQLLKNFCAAGANQTICQKVMTSVMNYVSFDRIDNQLWVRVRDGYREAEKICRQWYSEVQLDKNFEHDMGGSIADVTNGLLVTERDAQYIKEYQNCYKGIREYLEFPDYDNRIRILNAGRNELHRLTELGHQNPTLFFENDLLQIIEATEQNLDAIIQRTGDDYKPELSVEVPITNIPVNDGQISLSVTISNADNKATARNIELSILGLDRKKLGGKKVTESNLKGGASTSELVKIPVEDKEAFTITVYLDYADDDNQSYSAEKQISISTNAEDFEEIRNPYITGKPVVNDDMFFGRETMVQNLVNAISDDRIRCIIIYGQKRTGKSSIFDHLKRRLEDRFVVLNFSVGANIISEKDFYMSVQGELVNYLEDLDYDDETIEYYEDYDIAGFHEFVSFLRKVNRNVTQPAGKELLLMIDEFTHIYTYMKDPHYDINENFMDIWKAMIEADLFKSALIGQDFMPEFIQEYANQFQVTDPIKVTYLAKNDAIDLVTKPIRMKNGNSRFLENSEELIVDWFNGQPYYLQSYCSRLVDYINGEQRQNYVTTAVAQRVKDRMLAEVQNDFFDNLVRKDEEDLLEIVRKIAQASDTPEARIKVERLMLDDRQLEMLDRLAVRGVVDYTKADQRCRITIPFFYEWLRQA